MKTEVKDNCNDIIDEKDETTVLEIEDVSRVLLKTAEKTKAEMEEFYSQMLEKEILDDDVIKKASSLKRATSNTTRALAQTYSINDELNARWNDIKKQNKKRIISHAPANAEIDMREAKAGHFARGINIYKLLLTCFIGSFVGVIVEMIWCLITRGYIQSRAGLVYGPFNLLYGIGAVAITVSLYKFRNRGSWISFIGGFIIGSVLEYVCSWGQEMLFGTRSWDYSFRAFNLNGRICLFFSILWGFLGVFWIKNIYPRMSVLILKIPNKVGKILTWILVVFFSVNLGVSSLALHRFSERKQGILPENDFWEFIDERFPDDRMKKIYSNMQFEWGK